MRIMRINNFKEPSRTMPNRAQLLAGGSEQQNADKEINELIVWVKIYWIVNQSDNAFEQDLRKIPFSHNGFSLTYFDFRARFLQCALLIGNILHINYNRRISECIDIRQMHEHWTNIGILENKAEPKTWK